MMAWPVLSSVRALARTDSRSPIPHVVYRSHVVRLDDNGIITLPSLAAVAHTQVAVLTMDDVCKRLVKGGTFIDMKAAFDECALQTAAHRVWRL